MIKQYVAKILLLILLFILTAQAEEPDVVYTRARRLQQNGELAQAVTEYYNVRSPEYLVGSRAALAYALAAEELGDMVAAEDGYLYFLKNYPDSDFVGAAKLHLINLYIQHGEYASALFFLYGLSLDELNQKQLHQRCELIIGSYIGLLQFENARYYIEKYLQTNTEAEGFNRYKLWLAWYYSTRNVSRAVEMLQSIIDGSEDQVVCEAAIVYLVPVLVQNNREEEAVEAMLKLVEAGYHYSSVELLWLARYLYELRELTIAEDILQMVVLEPGSSMHEAIALYDLAKVEIDSRKFLDALSIFPLIQKALRSAEAGIGKIELLAKMADYSNALTLRRIGRNNLAQAILDRLQLDIYEPLYYNILYEQGAVDLSLGDVASAAEKLFRVGILSRDPDLAGRALLKCYEASKALNNSKLMRICLEDLAGANEGSYGELYPNSPYIDQALGLLQEGD